MKLLNIEQSLHVIKRYRDGLKANVHKLEFNENFKNRFVRHNILLTGEHQNI